MAIFTHWFEQKVLGAHGGEEEEYFDNPSIEYKVVESIEPYLRMAMEAYKDTDMAKKIQIVKKSHLIQNVLEPSCLLDVPLLPKITTDTEVHVCILEGDGRVAFVFRGTEVFDPKIFGDFMTDLMSKQVCVEHYNGSRTPIYRSQPYIKVHEGFQLALRDVTRTCRKKENLRLVVAEELKVNDVKEVVCIGHSLGGALATLCAHWCRYVAYPNASIQCVTIGSPRVGNKHFVDDFNNNVANKGSFRVVNKKDIVTTMPAILQHPLHQSPYEHVKGLLHLLDHPYLKESISMKRGGKQDIFLLQNWQDHSISAYKCSLEKLLYELRKHLHHN